VGWNPLEPSGVLEDLAGGFRVRNHTCRVHDTGYPVQGTQWLEINNIYKNYLFR